MKQKRIIRQFLWMGLFVFILMNLIACLHAYRFTHFDNSINKTEGANNLSIGQKIRALFTGINNPRPENKTIPDQKFETISLKSNKQIECWWIPVDLAYGSVILFHGYGGEKSSLLDKAAIFRRLGYNTLLVDFMGSGGSEGNQTTVGFFEAEQVRTAFQFLQTKNEKKIVLFGTSLGATAIMKCQKDYKLKATALLLECPFGTMLKTVKARFKTIGVPSFPMANLLVLWGGALNGFNAFKHNPIDYASSINCPTLLLYGEKDEKVSRKEMDAIFNNLSGDKKLATYPLAGHENYLHRYADKWTVDIKSFLQSGGSQTNDNTSQ